MRIHCNLSSNYCSACENNESVASSATTPQFKFTRAAAGEVPLLLLVVVDVDAAVAVGAPPHKLMTKKWNSP